MGIPIETTMMAPLTAVLFGVLLIGGGPLLVIDHPVIDYWNRLLTSIGTTQRPWDVEMSRTSILVGRITGAIAVLGIWLLVTEIA